MLRVAIPYGLLSSAAAHARAHRARATTAATATSRRARTCSTTGPKLERCPDILAQLATVEMHAIQTSGNCVRNITTDHFAGSRPTRSSIRARSPRSCGSGRRSIRNSTGCRASSRSRSTAPRPTAPPVLLATTSGTSWCATRRARSGQPRDRGRGMGRTPIIGHVIPALRCRGATCSPLSRRSSGSTTATSAATTYWKRASDPGEAWVPRNVARQFEAEWAGCRIRRQ
jgi:sulfite reductase (NADPH) hemoprotein beta-component